MKNSNPKKEITQKRATLAYIDFSAFPEENATGKNCVSYGGHSYDKNSYYRNSLRLLHQGSELICKFEMDWIPMNAKLLITHLSSYFKGCRNNGYSTVTIRVNLRVIVSNFSPQSHVMIN